MESQIPFPEINCFGDFTAALRKAGLTTGGPNGEGVFTLCDFFGPPVRWHTGDPETDPWEWRIRVLEECGDLAYGKIFFQKSGYLSREWYAPLLAVRRGGRTVEELFEDDPAARRIYGLVRENGPLPLHVIKQLGFFSKEEQPAFERALTRLQGRLFLTMCGREQKRSKAGTEYGWSSTVFCRTEERFGEEAFREAQKLDPEQAYRTLEEHLLQLNPGANRKKLVKFITGS